MAKQTQTATPTLTDDPEYRAAAEKADRLKRDLTVALAAAAVADQELTASGLARGMSDIEVEAQLLSGGEVKDTVARRRELIDRSAAADHRRLVLTRAVELAEAERDALRQSASRSVGARYEAAVIGPAAKTAAAALLAAGKAVVSTMRLIDAGQADGLTIQFFGIDRTDWDPRNDSGRLGRLLKEMAANGYLDPAALE